MSSSFVAQALRRALTESGARKVAHLTIPQVGPTLNQARNSHWRKLHRCKQIQYAALLQSLPSRPSDPEITTDWEPQQNTIWMPFDTADCSKMIPQSILRSSAARSVAHIFRKKKRS